jgi:hypothetical protein
MPDSIDGIRVSILLFPLSFAWPDALADRAALYGGAANGVMC